jgi:hypothetical protein
MNSFLRAISVVRKNSQKYDEDEDDLKIDLSIMEAEEPVNDLEDGPVAMDLREIEEKVSSLDWRQAKIGYFSRPVILFKKKMDEKNDEYREHRTYNKISSSVYATYFKSVLGWVSPIVIGLLFMTTQGLVMLTDYWCIFW